MVFGFSLFSSFNPFCIHCLYVRMVCGFFSVVELQSIFEFTFGVWVFFCC
jgi:hypothetical protein